MSCSTERCSTGVADPNDPTTPRAEASTPRLDRWLRGDMPRPWRTPEERALAIRAAFEAEQLPSLLEEHLPARILVSWRLARAAAEWAGLCGRNEFLADATIGLDPDPWIERAPIRPGAGTAARNGGSAVRRAWTEAGLPLLPPPEPGRIGRWCAAMAWFASGLGVGDSPQGEHALPALLDPRTAPMVGVTMDGILALEELAVDEVQEIVVSTGERAALRHFRDAYGMRRQEVAGLIALARSRAAELHTNDVEENRALMEAQLKDYLGRAKESLNMGDELRALRELARVQGLTRVDPDDLPRDFLAVVARVASRQDARVIDLPAQPPRLPEHEPAELDPTEDEHDAEALAEFDAERRRVVQ